MRLVSKIHVSSYAAASGKHPSLRPLSRFLLVTSMVLLVVVAAAPGNLLLATTSPTTDTDEGCTPTGCSECGDTTYDCPKGVSPPASTCNPVLLQHGTVSETVTDLTIDGPVFGWSMTRTYSGRVTGSTSLGNNWTAGDRDMRMFQDGNDITLFVNAGSKRVFTGSGSPLTFTSADDDSFELTHDTTEDEYVVTDTESNKRFIFHDFTVIPADERGLLKERTTIDWQSQSKAGIEYSYTSGDLTLITTADGQDYSIVFTYDGDTVTKVEVKNTSAVVIAQVEYTYYDDVTSPSTDLGSSGDLVQVKVSQDASVGSPGNLLINRDTQYRYDSNSSITAIFDNDSLHYMVNQLSGVTSIEDLLEKNDDYGTPELASYAGRRFAFYSGAVSTSNIATPFDATGEDLNTLYGGYEISENSGHVKTESIGPGCSSCSGSSGSGTKYYFYLGHFYTSTIDARAVTRITIEDTVDGDGNAVYRTIYGLNEKGRMLRRVLIEDPLGTPKYWCESWKYTPADPSRAYEYREPSAHDVTSASDLREFLEPYDPDTALGDTNDTNTLKASDGLTHVYSYYVTGMLHTHYVKKGAAGTLYCVEASDYGDGDGDSTGDDLANRTLEIASYYYPTQTTTRTDGIKTTYTYTFWDASDRNVKTKTTTLPVIPTSQNGSGVATTMVKYYDNLGRLRWTQDGEGYINYYSYDPETGGQAYVSIDVDPASPGSDVTSGSTDNWDDWTIGSANTNKPTRDSGLPTPLDLVTKRYYDDQGRGIRTVDDSGAEHYTVYEADRTIHFPYWQWDGTNGTTLKPISVTQLNDSGQVEHQFSIKAGYTGTTIDAASGGIPTGIPAAPNQADYVNWTRYNYDAQSGRLESVDRYHDIPSSGDGTLSTNYYRTITQYDAMGRTEYTIQVVSGTSASNRKEQVAQTIYDVRDRVIEVKMGVSGDSASNSHNMTDDYDTYPTLRTISKTVYDDGGVGDGYVTKSIRYHGTGTNDYTGVNNELTYRGHSRGVEPFYMNGSTETPYGPYVVTDIDWQGSNTATALYDTAPTWSTVLTGDGYTDYASSTSTDRRTLDETDFDDLGRPYDARRYKISASTGTGSNSLLNRVFYDRKNRIVARSKEFGFGVEYAYDGAGRKYQMRKVISLETTKYSSGVFQYRAPTPHPALASMTGGDDYVLTMQHIVYDGENLIEQHSFEDNHDDETSATRGIDLTNNDDYVRYSVYSWYDDADRVEVTAAYGSGDTTAGAGTWGYFAVPTRPSTAPTVSSDIKLVTLYAFNAENGALDTTTSPDGAVSKIFYDDLARTTYVVENYDDFNASTESNTGDSTDKSKDRVTKYEYDGLSGRTAIIALDANGDGTLTDNQTTRYLYENVVNASLPTNEIYPDSSDTTSSGSDQLKVEHNLDGSLSKRTDQRGTVLDFTYTNERTPELVKVTTLGGSTDGHIRSIKRSYNALGRLEKLTNYANADGSGTIRNEVQYEYDDLNQTAKVYQSHEGAVNTGTTPNVEYSYDDTTDGNVFSRSHRLESVTYPDGRVIFYDYDTANADYPSNRLSRVRKIRETNSTGTELVVYDYSGINRLAVVDFPEPDVKLDYYQDNSGTYAGFDRFARIKDQYWDGYNSTSDVDRFKYGYNYAGSRTYRDIDSAIYSSNDKDQAYTYDGLIRLTTLDEGTLSGATISGTPAIEQNWSLDSVGNWSNFLTKASGTTDLDQDRTTNKVNEITNITETTGPSWTTPAYDAAGNMTTVPKPTDLTAGYTATYDAFRRLVKIADGANTVAEYEYDGLNQRIVKKSYTSGVLDETRHFYYSQNWQVVEERVDSATDADRQFVWGTNYVDELILRDRDADSSSGNGLEERLYAMHDAQFSVTAVVNTAGAVQERFAFAPYGDTTVLDASFAAKQNGSDYDWEYRFTCRRWDSESGLNSVRNRPYHPQLGLWLQRDPLEYGDGMNLSQYVASDPLNLVDPFGLQNYVAGNWGPGGQLSAFLNISKCRTQGEGTHILTFDQMYDIILLKRPGLKRGRTVGHVLAGLPSPARAELGGGCIGISSCFLGYELDRKSDLNNCYKTLQDALRVRNKWRSEKRCCKKGEKNVNGRPAQAQVVGYEWGDGPELQPGQKPWSTCPGCGFVHWNDSIPAPVGQVFDWGFYDDDMGGYWRAVYSEISTFEDGSPAYCHFSKDFHPDVAGKVFCVLCERDDLAK